MKNLITTSFRLKTNHGNGTMIAAINICVNFALLNLVKNALADDKVIKAPSNVVGLPVSNVGPEGLGAV
jgi:hypothetical protein